MITSLLAATLLHQVVLLEIPPQAAPFPPGNELVLSDAELSALVKGLSEKQARVLSAPLIEAGPDQPAKLEVGTSASKLELDILPGPTNSTFLFNYDAKPQHYSARFVLPPGEGSWSFALDERHVLLGRQESVADPEATAKAEHRWRELTAPLRR